MLGKMAYGARAWRLTCTHRRERRVAPDRTRAAALQKEPSLFVPLFVTGPFSPSSAARSRRLQDEPPSGNPARKKYELPP